MDDPFSGLRRNREAQEEQIRKEREEKEKARRVTAQKYWEAHNSYNEIVTSVLEQLRQAAYPHAKLHGGTPVPSDFYYSENAKIRWDISEYDSGLWDDPGDWHTHVEINIVFDAHDRPICFECHANGQSRRTQSFSSEGLVEILQQLHSTSDSANLHKKETSWRDRLLGG